MDSAKKIGLSLSGGGYRAAAFHLGTLQKLHELGILGAVNFMSTISGGSITGAYYCLKGEGAPEIIDEMKVLLTTKSVIRYVLLSARFLLFTVIVSLSLLYSVYSVFTSQAWISLVIMAAFILLISLFQFKLLPISKIIEKAYDKFFFEGAFLLDLKTSKPKLVIGSTNIQTCRSFSFSREKMGDSSYWISRNIPVFIPTGFPLSRAVMASSCVPFAFSPIVIEKKYYTFPDRACEWNPVLVDGGVYDNQGIHKLTQKKSEYFSDIVITSDAGNKLPFEKSYNNVFVLLLRTMNVFMARIKNFQMVQNIYGNTDTVNREIAFFSLGWTLEECVLGFIRNLYEGNIVQSVLNSHKIPIEWQSHIKEHEQNILRLLKTEIGYEQIKLRDLTPEDFDVARKVGTNLTRLSPRQVDCLMRHAANLCELQTKIYCPSLFIHHSNSPTY